MSPRSRRALLQYLGGLAVGLAGCQGGPPTDTATGTPDPTEAPTADRTPMATGTPTDTATPSPDDTPTDEPTPGRVDRRCSAIWEPIERWRVPTGIRAYEPAVVDGTVYFGAQDDRLRAVDAADGTVRWRRKRAVPLYTRPAVSADTVVAPTYDAVVAHATADGTRRWSFEPPGSQAEIESAAVLVGGYVATVVTNYAGTQEEPPENPYTRLYGLDLDTGTEVWHREFERDYFIQGLASSDSAVVLAGRNGDVFGYDPASGDVAWSSSVGGEVGGGPATASGLVAVRGGDFLAAVEAGTGTVRWKTEGDFHDRPAVASGTVYCPTRGELVALDAATGDRRWRAAIDGDTVGETSAIGEVVYCTVTEGDRAWKLGLDAAEGCRRGRFEGDGRNLTRAHVAGDSVYFGGLHGEGAMYAVTRPSRRDT